jgi:O-antigen ligase
LPLVLFAATSFLFISKSLYNVPIAIMALIGLYRTIRSPRHVWDDQLTRIFIILFICIWIPLLISLIDAVNISRSAKTAFGYLRFLFMGIYLLQPLKSRDIWHNLRLFIFCLMVFWSIDGVIQIFIGKNVFGYPLVTGQVTGMFYPRFTIAHILAALSPLYIDFIFLRSKRSEWLWLLLVPLVVVILMSGRRGTWIMLFISMSGYLFYLIQQKLLDKKMFKSLSLTAVIIISAAILMIMFSKPLQERIDNTMQLFSGEYEKIDEATSHRLPIWKASIAIINDHWVNGIGPRGFRYSYDDYSGENDIWSGQMPAHPHQMYIEILVETGLIGLFGLLSAIGVFYFYIKRLTKISQLFPSILCMIVAIFPFNTHMAFYSSYWSSFLWCLILIIFVNSRYLINTRQAEDI